MEEEVISVVAEIEGSSKVVKTKKQISLRDRIKAAELLGKRYGLWTEKQEVDINLPTFIDDIKEVD